MSRDTQRSYTLYEEQCFSVLDDRRKKILFKDILIKSDEKFLITLIYR